MENAKELSLLKPCGGKEISFGWNMAAGAAAGLTLPRTESFPSLFNAVKRVIERLNGVIMMSN